MSYKSKFTGEQVDEYLTRVEEAGNLLETKEEVAKKANTEGYYPELTVGMSDGLVGRGESTPAEFSFRASGGKSIKDGSARIKTLHGNAVVWNQGFPDQEWQVQDGTLVKDGDSYVVTPTGEYPGIFPGDMYNVRPWPTEKILVELDFYSEGNASHIGINLCGNNISDYNLQLNTWQHIAIIATCDREDPFGGAVIFGSASASVLKFKNMRFHNLTKMFGAGKEPTTIEEYNARKPIVEDEYAYNEGAIIPFTAEGIKSIGDNAWDEEWEMGYIYPNTGEIVNSPYCIRSKNFNRIIGGQDYYLVGNDFTIVLYDKNYQWIDFWGALGEPRMVHIDDRARYFRIVFNESYGTTYKNDAMVSLYHSGWKAEVDATYKPYWEDIRKIDSRIAKEFPNGMMPWDKVYNKNGKGHSLKGMSVVDLGSLDWQNNDTVNGGVRFSANKENWTHPSDNTMLGNIICPRYSVISADDSYLEQQGIALGRFGDIFIYDSSYTDAASLKESLAGVPLYYQLAEPTIIEYDEPFNLDYEVADFGTEEIIASKPSAPIKADIIYQFNAVDMIRENYNEIQQLKTMIATMSAQMASLTSNNNN